MGARLLRGRGVIQVHGQQHGQSTDRLWRGIGNISDQTFGALDLARSDLGLRAQSPIEFICGIEPGGVRR